MQVVLIGAGTVGREVARALVPGGEVSSLIVVDRDPGRAEALAGELGPPAEPAGRVGSDLPPGDVTVIAAPGAARRRAKAAVAAGSHVVSVSDDLAEIRHLRALDAHARAHGRTVVLGAAMAPGLSCILARELSHQVDVAAEIHVASAGTGGPDCARRHHAALTSMALDWEDGDWRRRPGGSGRELVWFPDPVGGADCYRAGLPDPLLLVGAFPGIRRVTSRLEATRRDRMTSWLPMLRPPHPEGLVGAVRVELRGRIAGRAETRILGATGRPAAIAGAVATTAARWAVAGRLARTGSAGLAEMVDEPRPFLRDLYARGVRVAAFEGVDPYGDRDSRPA